MTLAKHEACHACGMHDMQDRPWVLDIYEAVHGAKPEHAFYLPDLADAVAEMAARLKGLEK